MKSNDNKDSKTKVTDRGNIVLAIDAPLRVISRIIMIILLLVKITIIMMMLFTMVMITTIRNKLKE